MRVRVRFPPLFYTYTYELPLRGHRLPYVYSPWGLWGVCSMNGGICHWLKFRRRARPWHQADDVAQEEPAAFFSRLMASKRRPPSPQEGSLAEDYWSKEDWSDPKARSGGWTLLVSIGIPGEIPHGRRGAHPSFPAALAAMGPLLGCCVLAAPVCTLGPMSPGRSRRSSTIFQEAWAWI